MPIRQQITSIVFCIVFFIFIIELVRRRKLKEEYSFLWIMINIIFFLLILKIEILQMISRFFGIALTSSTLFFLGISFLLVYSIFISTKISTMTRQIKNLVQELSLLKFEVENKKNFDRIE